MTDPIAATNLANYDSDWSAAEYARQQGLWPIESELIERYFPAPPGRVLDLGCGAGRTSIGLHELGYAVSAIDLSERLLEIARQRFPQIDFRVMDAANLEFEDRSFDAAQFSYNGIDCIFPVEQRVRCMREVFRVLKPGGTFILSSHNLLGACFSGGYFYPQGYVNAAKELVRQIGNPHFLRGYVRYSDGGGAQHLYSRRPSKTIDQLKATGFEVIELIGATGERRSQAITMHQRHVYFVARRPV